MSQIYTDLRIRTVSIISQNPELTYAISVIRIAGISKFLAECVCDCMLPSLLFCVNYCCCIILCSFILWCSIQSSVVWGFML